MALYVFLDNKNVLSYLDLFLLASIIGELFLCKTEGYIELFTTEHWQVLEFEINWAKCFDGM